MLIKTFHTTTLDDYAECHYAECHYPECPGTTDVNAASKKDLRIMAHNYNTLLQIYYQAGKASKACNEQTLQLICRSINDKETKFEDISVDDKKDIPHNDSQQDITEQ